MQDAIDSVKLNRNIPLQRQKTAEISFVLKAIATRLGFDLVSHRLELFGRRREPQPAETAAPKRAPNGTGRRP